MLRHLEHQPDRIVQDLKGGEDRRQALVEPDIDDSTDHLADASDGAGSGELVSDLTGGAGGLGRRVRRRLRRGGRGGGGVVGGAVKEEASGRGASDRR